MSANNINLSGKIAIKATDAQRLSVYVTRGKETLASAPVQANGSYRLNLSRQAASAPSAYGLNLAVAPTSLGSHLDHIADVPQISLHRETLLKAEKDFRVEEEIKVSDAVLTRFWGWCAPYCVSGTVVGPDGCPAPGAEVTVYSVGFNYSKYARATVTTAPDGTFTACFDWCRCIFCFPCWDCWPIWWECWPWWWELDILHVIEAIERTPVLPGPGPVERFAGQASLIRPEGRDLVRGKGFVASHREPLAQNLERTALIRTKLADARIRALFPWWWWCCDDPNLLFSVQQGGYLIVNENPYWDTRWCFEDGSSVTLVGNQQTSTVCNPNNPPESGFVWTNVGNIDVSNITLGYATAYTGDYSDLAFAGTLDLYGMFANNSGVAYYQVEAGKWGGTTANPARGGTAPGASAPVYADLYRTVYIYNQNGTFNTSAQLKMGPFTDAGLVGLYATPLARQNGPTPPGIGFAAFPPIPPGGTAYWDKQGLMLEVDSEVLVGGPQMSGVDLTVLGYDAAFAPVTLSPDDPLTLLIDNTSVFQHLNSISPFDKNNNPVPLSSGTNLECPGYDIGPSGYVDINISVSDANGHLFGYYLDAEYGHGSGGPVATPRGYVSNPLINGPDPNYGLKSWIGSGETMRYFPPVDCCYEFRIRYAKRVTNGYSLPAWSDGDFQTIGLKVSS